MNRRVEVLGILYLTEKQSQRDCASIATKPIDLFTTPAGSAIPQSLWHPAGVQNMWKFSAPPVNNKYGNRTDNWK